MAETRLDYWDITFEDTEIHDVVDITSLIQPRSSTCKTCQGCKKFLNMEAFMVGDKEYNRCFICRQKRIKTDTKKCAEENCSTRPSFNYEGESKGKFCAKHKAPNMVNVVTEKCKHVGCSKRPNFNFEGETKVLFCVLHKEPNMVNVKDKKCKHEGCSKIPTFNFEGETKALFCVLHKEPDMVDVKSKKCKHVGCSKQPTFNFEGETKALFCVLHKEPNMVDVKNKKCKHVGCSKIPNFNYEGETKALFCVLHKEPNMVDVKNKKCKHVGCSKIPVFNFEGETKALFCVLHKEPNMVNVKSKKCKHVGCSKIPTFNFEGETKALFCVLHKEPNMIDVKHVKCVNCKKIAYYGFPNQGLSFCKTHRIPGTIISPNRKCNNCNEKALYGIKEPIHCEIHKENAEENLCLQICRRCGNTEICNKEGICFEYCINSDLFKRSKHNKEIRVVNLLRSEIKQEFYSLDKPIDTNCNLKRPDIVYDCKTHFLVIEVDEHQHSTYDKSCEMIRMKGIVHAIGMPTIFIRYNPDHYKDNLGKKGTIIRADREKLFIQWVRHILTLAPKNSDEFFRILYLFYDGFDKNNGRINNENL